MRKNWGMNVSFYRKSSHLLQLFANYGLKLRWHTSPNLQINWFSSILFLSNSETSNNSYGPTLLSVSFQSPIFSIYATFPFPFNFIMAHSTLIIQVTCINYRFILIKYLSNHLFCTPSFVSFLSISLHTRHFSWLSSTTLLLFIHALLLGICIWLLIWVVGFDVLKLALQLNRGWRWNCAWAMQSDNYALYIFLFNKSLRSVRGSSGIDPEDEQSQKITCSFS